MHYLHINKPCNNAKMLTTSLDEDKNSMGKPDLDNIYYSTTIRNYKH